MVGPLRTWIEYVRRYGFVLAAVGMIEHVLNDRYYAYLKRSYYRRRIKETAEEVGTGLWVGGKSKVNANTVLGDNVNLNGMNVLGEGPVVIGDNFHSGAGCEIITENHNYDDGETIPYDETFITESVEIGDNVWVGLNVIVIPGITIEEGAIVQSGSVVTKDIPSGAIAGGNPIEVFDQRDMDHYRELKSEGKFH